MSFSRGSVITEIAIKFTRQLESEDKTMLLQTFYEAVELNGTIGDLQVTKLYAEDKTGKLLSTLCCGHMNKVRSGQVMILIERVASCVTTGGGDKRCSMRLFIILSKVSS